MPITVPTLRVVELAGADAPAFAHAQFASDVRTLGDGRWQWSAWLSPQGRVRAFFHLLRDGGERLRLLLRGGDTHALCAELSRYVLRSRVTLRVCAATAVAGIVDAAACAAIGADPPAADELRATPQGTLLTLRGARPRGLLVRAADATPIDEDPAALDRWRLADIRDGLPELDAALAGELLPPWLGLDRLGAISTGKGCYPGQEVVARLHFKGGNKRHLYRLRVPGAPPTPGTSVHDESSQQPVGVIVLAARADAEGSEALASLVDAAAAGRLRLADTPMTVTVLERFA
jgi:folate-binding protein YgfZ